MRQSAQRVLGKVAWFILGDAQEKQQNSQDKFYLHTLEH